MERATPERTPHAAISAPSGSRFKGCEDFVVQDLHLEARVIRYRRQRWLTPDGRTLVAPLPAGPPAGRCAACKTVFRGGLGGRKA